MPLPTGTWKMNVNGKELDFTIQSVQVQEGQGVFSAFLLAESLTGFWDEVSQTITFGLTKGQGPGGVAAVFKGYLFRSPENPEPGRDVVATLGWFCSSQHWGLRRGQPDRILPAQCVWLVRSNY